MNSELQRFLVSSGRLNETQTFDAMPVELAERLVQGMMGGSGVSSGGDHGMSADYLDKLERVSRTDLRDDWTCAICTQRYVDDKYPLVVRLPCNHEHHFDLECIALWLKANTTCPLCRASLCGVRKPSLVIQNSDDEWDDTFA